MTSGVPRNYSPTHRGGKVRKCDEVHLHEAQYQAALARRAHEASDDTCPYYDACLTLAYRRFDTYVCPKDGCAKTEDSPKKNDGEARIRLGKRPVVKKRTTRFSRSLLEADESEESDT